LIHFYKRDKMGKHKNKQKKALKTKSKDDTVSQESISKKLGEKNLDEFMEGWDDDDSDDEVETDSPEVVTESRETEEPHEEEMKEDEDQSDDECEEEASSKQSSVRGQKKYIASLKDKDPDFYNFLKENDEELLNFDESTDEEEEDEDKEEGVHELPDKLEVASDESDYEMDEDQAEPSGSKKKLNQAQVTAWQESLEKQPSFALVTDVIEGFRGAVKSVALPDKSGEETIPVKYHVEGGALFNSVVRLCVINLQPALKTVLKLDADSASKPSKAKNWKKMEKIVRAYLIDLITLLGRINEESVLRVLLKHVHSMLPYYQAFQKSAKLLMSKLILMWSRQGETARILAFMCLVKLVRGNQSQLLEAAVKAMYLAYVKNCKFTSPSTISSIGFMKRSLVELMCLDHNLAYYQAFVYIRQLAIHLRNAITCSEKKDSLLAVYNWQFIHSLELWAALVGHAGASSETLQPLVYPLVQVVIGTAKLIPTSKYFPLRFHCARILATISATTGTFIPVLPFYLEVLNTHNFNKKAKKASMKPIDFSCILKLSKSQLGESAFKDATMEELYGGLLTYLADNSNKIAFPELVTPMIFQLKDFLKNCKVANYSKKIKQILEKTQANQKFIETRRKNVSFGIGDKQQIQVWESQVVRDGTPLLAFFKNWKKVTDLTMAKKVSEQQKLDDYANVPLLKKNKKRMQMREENKEVEEVTGFLSGSEDDDFDEEENFKLKEDRKRKVDETEEGNALPEKSKKKKKPAAAPAVEPEAEGSDEDDEDDDDLVEDMKLEDLESESEDDLKDEFDGDDAGEEDSDSEDDSD